MDPGARWGPPAATDASRWLTVWRHEQRRASHCLPGRPLNRGQLHDTIALGRSAFRQNKQLDHVLDHSGAAVTEPADIEALLWQSRAPIWDAVPDKPAAADRLLDSYFATRAALHPPTLDDVTNLALANSVLHGKHSAPGGDGMPYEFLHGGLAFVVPLLGGLLRTSERGYQTLQNALGPSIDLLVWIPKTGKPPTPDGLRGLQLPTVLRRLFGAVVGQHIGPIIEPLMLQSQAGKRGGTCRPRIHAALRHLGGDERAAAEHVAAGDLTDEALFGRQHTTVRDWVEGQQSQPLGPAVLCVDQSKAFERLSHSWLVAVLRRWGLPPWILHGFLALTAGRAVQSVGRAVGKARPLRCGLGMGGTLSPLAWCLAYDPIVFGLEPCWTPKLPPTLTTQPSWSGLLPRATRLSSSSAPSGALLA